MMIQNVSQLLKKLREQAGKTQAEAAAECCVSQRIWERYESGDATISATTLKLFCVLNSIDAEHALKMLHRLKESKMESTETHLRKMATIARENAILKTGNEGIAMEIILNMLVKSQQQHTVGTLVAAANDVILMKLGYKPCFDAVTELCDVFMDMYKTIYRSNVDRLKMDRDIIIRSYRSYILEK